MDKKTIEKMNGYLTKVAQMNGLSSKEQTAEQFAVKPEVQQRLENKMQESNGFLSLINVVPVKNQEGEAVLLGISGPLARTVDTSNKERTTSNVTTLDGNRYRCEQTNFDTDLSYEQLDAWAMFPDFDKRVAAQKIIRIGLDRIMIGLNGVKRVKDSDPVNNPLLQDVNIGWLQLLRDRAPQRVMKEEVVGSGKIEVGENKTYKNLDALVTAAKNDLIAEWCREDTNLVAITSSNLLTDKYFPLVNKHGQPTELLASDVIISQKRIGGLPAVRVPFMPDGTILITPLKNLSLYYQAGAMRRNILNNPRRNRYEDFLSSNDAYVIENYDCAALLENIEMVD